jgi:putative tricarboxylic transport membrane protein
MLVIVNLPLVGVWVSMLRIPYHWLCSIILVFACIGVYTVNGSPIDVGMAAGFGLLGYIFVKLGCGLAPFMLGFILGPLLEENFRRAMLISRGDPSVFLLEPISAAFLLAAIIIVVSMAFSAFRRPSSEAVSG